MTATLFFCAASVVSCQKEETAGAAPSCAAIRLTAEPAELVRTKSETDVAYASRFVEGDAIGLFAVIRTDAETQAYPAASGNYIQNAKFVRQADGSWREEGSKSYYMEQGQVMDLYAYYPYAENADPTALVYDASVAEADFMTARTPGFSERDGEIRLVFRHKLALAEAFVADADKLADYAVTVQEPGVAWASKNMLVLGFIILGGLLIHLFNFWSKMQLVEILGGHENSLGLDPADGASLIAYTFSQWYYVVIYLVWFAALWFHLTHGVWSMFQTVGWANDTWYPRLKCIANIVATIISVSYTHLRAHET